MYLKSIHRGTTEDAANKCFVWRRRLASRQAVTERGLGERKEGRFRKASLLDMT